MKLQSLLLASASIFGTLLPSIGVNGASVMESTLSIPFLTIFTRSDTDVTIDLVWDFPTDFETTDILTYTINGDGENTTYTISLDGAEELPSSISATYMTKKAGRVDIEVGIELSSMAVGSASNSYQAYGEGASLVPLIIIVILGFYTKVVELALGMGVFIGACMVSGNVRDGFTSTLEKYILGAVADEGHAYVFMFTAFLGGFVALLEYSGGFKGFGTAVKKFTSNARSAQMSAFLSGIIIFFDDYANCLVVGGTLRPIMDALNVSREKLAFIVDATAAPIASLVPVSSWVGFEIGLIQDEIDKITEIFGDDLYIKSSGFSVFIDSIKFRYYSLFMIMFIPIMIILKRDFGPMLVAERKCVVYKRTDGGDGKSDRKANGESSCAPKEDTPGLWWNYFIPLFFLIFFIFYIMVQSGDDGSGEQTFIDKIEASDSFVALLYGSMAASLLSMAMFLVQFKQDGKLVVPAPKSFLTFCGPRLTEEQNTNLPVPLVSIREGTDVFVQGHLKVFPALIILTLAWACATVMVDVGADRLFARWILDSGMHAGALPTLSFLIAMLIAFSTGTSWGTMGILFPLIAVPTYEAAMGDARTFNATISGILAGSIMGDHLSPISDTTILSCTATQCGLMEHVKTQMPYAGVVAFWSVLLGTLPIGFSKGYPNAFAIILGLIAIALTVFILGVPVVNKTGKFDIGTELYMKFNKGSELHKLKEDTVAFFYVSTETARLEPEKDLEFDKIIEEDASSDLE